MSRQFLIFINNFHTPSLLQKISINNYLNVLSADTLFCSYNFILTQIQTQDIERNLIYVQAELKVHCSASFNK